MTFGGSDLERDYAAMRDLPEKALESFQPTKSLPFLISPSMRTLSLQLLVLESQKLSFIIAFGFI